MKRDNAEPRIGNKSDPERLEDLVQMKQPGWTPAWEREEEALAAVPPAPVWTRYIDSRLKHFNTR